MTKNLYISSLLDVYGDFLGEKPRKLTECYYNEDLSLSEIAENEGITRQGVRDALKKSEEFLFAADEKLGVIKRNREILKIADELASISDVDAARELANRLRNI